MHQWYFVIAAYALALGATIAMSLLCWRTMRRAERAVGRVSDAA